MRNHHFLKSSCFVLLVALAFSGIAVAGQKTPQAKQTPQANAAQNPSASSASAAVNLIIDKIVARERLLGKRMHQLHPIVETYLQTLDKDDELTFRPTGDQYFLTKLDLDAEDKGESMVKRGGFTKNLFGMFSQIYSVKYLPGGFAQMLFIGGDFDRQNYEWEYVKREFLGEVRTVVFDVRPKKEAPGAFRGRVWAEDQDFHIVRFNGTYGPSSSTKMYFHFDSWRELVGNNEWLPAYVYTEESNLGYLMGARHMRFKGQLRLWGYNVVKPNAQDELTALIVESDKVQDNADQAESISPVRALRSWERDAEDNLIQRLQKAGLMAPDGEVNKVIETVINNLIVTNNLEIEPEVRARVLLTTPLESFTIGNTIVLSRGLIDVLPDEASLAMIVAHELAHIALGHQIDTKYSFNDRMLFDDPEAFQQIDLKRDPREEEEADQKAAELLKKSPYRDKLGNAGLFLKALDERAPQLKHLLLPHVGNSMVQGGAVRRMAELEQHAPKLETANIKQIAALPLGGRVSVDPWTAKIEMMKSKPVALLSAREKMPFEVAPVYLYLTRQEPADQKQANAATSKTPASQ